MTTIKIELKILKNCYKRPVLLLTSILLLSLAIVNYCGAATDRLGRAITGKNSIVNRQFADAGDRFGRQPKSAYDIMPTSDDSQAIMPSGDRNPSRFSRRSGSSRRDRDSRRSKNSKRDRNTRTDRNTGSTRNSRPNKTPQTNRNNSTNGNNSLSEQDVTASQLNLEKPTLTTKTVSGLVSSKGSTDNTGNTNIISGDAKQGMLNLDFRNTDLKTIINFLSEQTQTNYLYDENLRGKITLVGPKKVPVDEAVWLLESLLEFKGYTVVKIGDFKKVIPLAKAQGEKIETRLTYKESNLPELAENKEITQLIKLEHTNAADIKAAIAGLLAKPNSVITYAHTNTLIITENALNIRRIVRIIKELDVPVFGKKIHMVPLKFTQAASIAKELEALLKQKAAEKLSPETRQQKISAPSIIAEERTNSLILICLERDYVRLRELIRNFDHDISALPTLKIRRIKYAKAEEITATIEKLLKSGNTKTATAITVTADKRTNSIILSSMSAHLIKRAMKIIEQLDLEVEPEQNILVKVHKLEFAEAEKVAELLGGFSFVPVEELKAQNTSINKDQKSNSQNEITIIPDPSTNSLIITTPKYRWPHILEVIKELDKVKPQVMVEVLVVEIDVSHARELGIDFNLMDQNGEGNRPFAIGNADNIENFLSSSGIANGLSLGILTGGAFDFGAAMGGDVGELSQIGVLIRAMQNDTRANILSTPTILTSDNETAKISVGEQIQLPSSLNTAANSGLNTITDFSTEELGVILELTPRITKDEHVLLKINQTIKARTNDTLYAQNVPVISKREIDTSVTVLNNTTIALGGIISEEETIERTKIPFLSDIPGIGKLFRNKKTRNRKINLMIFLTPHIIRCQEDAERVTRMQRATIRDFIVEEKGTAKNLTSSLNDLKISEEQAANMNNMPLPASVDRLSDPKPIYLRTREIFEQYKKENENNKNKG